MVGFEECIGFGPVQKDQGYIPNMGLKIDKGSEIVWHRECSGDCVWMPTKYLNSWSNFPDSFKSI